MSDYERIAEAIAFMRAHVTAQPSLDDVAAHLRLSPFHFQRLFGRWAGTTPKRFLQVLTLELGKTLLAESNAPLLEVTDCLGLSSSSRLHEHFVTLDAVTPGEYRDKGKDLLIAYGVSETLFGRLFVARTRRGVCRAAFLSPHATTEEEVAQQIAALRKMWPLATFEHQVHSAADVAAAMSGPAADAPRPLSLYVHGTNFQLAVWRALLRIPLGGAVTYSHVAEAVGARRAVRAVGTAIGANPVAFLIPCHRVIQQSGALGGYRWGPERKQALQTWERVSLNIGARAL